MSHNKRICYNINVLLQTACLVVNLITAGSFNFLFNCTPTGRTSDPMIVRLSLLFDRHRFHMAAKFGVFLDENHSKLPTLNWLPKLHKRPYKSKYYLQQTSACYSALQRTLCPLNGWPPHRVCNCPKLSRAHRRHKQIYDPINPK